MERDVDEGAQLPDRPAELRADAPLRRTVRGASAWAIVVDVVRPGRQAGFCAAALCPARRPKKLPSPSDVPEA